MMKTPDEIKKGLECCKEDECFGERENCPYTADPNLCVGVMCADALDLILQLESDKQQLEGMLTHMNQLRDAAAGRALKMEERVRQLEAERDAAVADLKELASKHGSCFGCKSYTGEHCGNTEYKIICSFHADKWEWRGVQKEAFDDPKAAD